MNTKINHILHLPHCLNLMQITNQFNCWTAHDIDDFAPCANFLEKCGEINGKVDTPR